ncbi:MAG: hypothetical protein HFI75_11475 [Lachnospiraceae bacterium]|nr:hypothetical protein [Lachnospiraceae bacterium]
MENSLKGLVLAAGTIITCIVIGLGFYIAREARDTASSGAGQINKLNAEFSDTSKTMYEGTEVSGSEVLNVIRKFQDEAVGIMVKTNKTSTYYIYQFDTSSGELKGKTTEDYKVAQNELSNSYINPNGRFEGGVVRDSNGTITGLTFTQK